MSFGHNGFFTSNSGTSGANGFSSSNREQHVPSAPSIPPSVPSSTPYYPPSVPTVTSYSVFSPQPSYGYTTIHTTEDPCCPNSGYSSSNRESYYERSSCRII